MSKENIIPFPHREIPNNVITLPTGIGQPSIGELVDTSMIIKGKKVDRQQRMIHASNLINSHSPQVSGVLAERQDMVLDTQPSYTRDLMSILSPRDFDRVGHFLRTKLKDKPASESELFGGDDSPQEIPDIVLRKMIDGFIETGFVAYNKDGSLKLTKRGKQDRIDHDALKSTLLAADILNVDYPHRRVQRMRDIEEAHEINPNMQVDKVDVGVEGGSAKVLYLSEILVGNNASDIGFLRKTLKRIKRLPEDMRPNVIIVSGIMEGSHKFRNKDARQGLTQGLDQQFASAKLILDEIESTGAKVIYLLSNNDREIARDGTIEAMRTIKNLAEPLSDKDKGHVTYWQQDQLKQNEAWDQNMRFQLDVVFPYSLKSGRRLRSADEVARITKGKLRIEEYLLLWEAHRALLRREEVPEVYKRVLNLDNIPVSGRKDTGIRVTDGVDLTLTTSKGRDVTHMVRESLKFGSSPMYQSPSDAAEAVQKQLITDGQDTPDVLTVLDQQQGFGIGGREGWVVFAPGFTETKRLLKQKGTIARAGYSAAWRQLTTRRVLGEPAATMHEITEDGRHIITIFNAKLLDKADAADRSTIALLTDWQTGSTTARPDLQVKFADIVGNLMKDRPTYLFTDGDMIQGRNYKGMPEENAHIGLVRIEDQQAFVKEMLERSFAHVSKADFENLKKVGIVPGNHEWNSGYVLNGAIFNLYLVQAFQRMFAERGLIPASDQIKAYESVLTNSGDFLKAWTAFEEIAGYGAHFSHIIQEKGGKGGGSKPPVFQAQGQFEGLGEVIKNTDIALYGHWHHPQYGLFGNKLAAIAPSLAGLSGFELVRGYLPTMGGLMVHLGGGLPPQLEVLGTEALNKHQISEGAYSDATLKRDGFKDDKHFDPVKHGFANRRVPQSALQKSLWHLRDEIVFNVGSTISA